MPRITFAAALILFALARSSSADPITATLLIQVEERCLAARGESRIRLTY